MLRLTFTVYKGSNNMKTVDWSSPWMFCFAVQQSEHPCGAPRPHFHSAINLYVLLYLSPGTQPSTRLWASSMLRKVYWMSILNVINPKLSVYPCVQLLLPSFKKKFAQSSYGVMGRRLFISNNQSLVEQRLSHHTMSPKFPLGFWRLSHGCKFRLNSISNVCKLVS